jgi:predicted outer membrane protein
MRGIVPQFRSILVASAAVLSLRCASNGQLPPSALVYPAATGTAPGLGFDDSSIATIAESIADGQEVRARLGIRRGEDVRVRRFATALDADLPGAKIAMMQLGPRPSVIDAEVANTTDRDLRDLDLRRGSDFDRAFVASEQTSLVTALRVLDGIIPKAGNEELARRLGHMRAVLADELPKAHALAGALRSAGATSLGYVPTGQPKQRDGAEHGKGQDGRDLADAKLARHEDGDRAERGPCP